MKKKTTKKISNSKTCVPVAKLKNNLRRLHNHCPEKKKVLDRTKVDLSTNACEYCNKYVYSGTSDKRFSEFQDKYPDKVLEKGILEVHHLEPVVDPKVGVSTWDDFIHRLWVKAEYMKGLCRDCHKKESEKETAERVESGSLKRKDK